MYLVDCQDLRETTGNHFSSIGYCNSELIGPVLVMISFVPLILCLSMYIFVLVHSALTQMVSLIVLSVLYFSLESVF